MEQRVEYLTGNEPREVSFIVDGQPIPKARARVILQPGRKAHAFTPRTTKEWSATISLSAKITMALQHYTEPFPGDVEVTLWIYSKDRRRRDADNQEKNVFDSMNKIVYLDDSQIADHHTYRRLDRERPRVEVRVREITL